MIKSKLSLFFSIILLIYLLSFIKYLEDINYKPELSKETQAVVVLTGSQGRVGLGLDYLKNKPNIKMLISGVGEGVKYSDLAIDNSFNKKNITLGFKAKNTIQNAFETFEWVKKYNIKSFVLITDNWHMKRSLLLFKSIMPDIKILPRILKSINIEPNYFLHEPKAFSILVIEHLKYLISYVQIIYYWISN